MHFYIGRRSSVCSMSSTSTSTSASHEDPSNLSLAATAISSQTALMRTVTATTDATAATLLPWRSSRHSSIASEHSCEGMSPDETQGLWRCMLTLQERYGCYNSTRIDLAVGAGEAAMSLMPNPFIIDTLNQSVHDLPDEGWEMLEHYLGVERRSGERPAKE